MDMNSCLAVSAQISDRDRDDLLQRVDSLIASGLPTDQAQTMAANDLLADIEAEQAEMMAAVKAQHPDLFETRVEVPQDAAAEPVTEPYRSQYFSEGLQYSARRMASRTPLSTIRLMQMGEEEARSEVGLNPKPKRGDGNSTRKIGEALNRRTLTLSTPIAHDDVTPESAMKLATAMAEEVRFQLTGNSTTGTGLGWYSHNYPRALTILARRFPELATHRSARSVFTALVAVTSNGEKVTKNIANAITLYSDFRQGQPLVAMNNRRATALEANLIEIEQLIALHGLDGFAANLMQETTVGELNRALRAQGKDADSSYEAATVVPKAALHFGPKLGAFFANLMGSEGYLTMDLWWSRSINRMRGTLVPHATESSLQNLRQLLGQEGLSRDQTAAASVTPALQYGSRNFVTALEALMGSKEPQKPAQKPGKKDAASVLAWSQKKGAYEAWIEESKAMAGDSYAEMHREHLLEKAANTIYKNEYLMLEEAPFRASDRSFMYSAARNAQRLLRNSGTPLSLADIQAALWYYEKRLYQKLSGRKADDIGYEEALLAQADQGAGRERPSTRFSGRGDFVDVAYRSLPVEGEALGRGDSQGPEAEGGDGGLSYSRRQTFDTPAFQRWFGDSKVVDENGEPLVVYHGTKRDFTEFVAKYADGLSFFSTNPQFASKWAVGFGGKGDLREPPAGTKEEYQRIRDAEDRLRLQYMKESYDLDTEQGVKDFDADRKAFKDAVSKETGFSSSSEFEGNAGNRVMPVYLSAQNPFDPRTDWKKIEEYLTKTGNKNLVDRDYHKSGNWLVYEDKGVIDELKRLGYDAIWLAENIGGPHETIAVFNPTQIKSAIGNNGEFDPENPSINYSRRQGSYGLRAFGLKDSLIEGVQDRYNRWQQATQDIREQGGVVSEANDFYRAEERYWGQVGARIDDFKVDIDDFIRSVADAGLKLEDVALYAYAQHAPERNAWIAARRASMPDGGSGMTNDQAQAILDDAQQAGLETELQRHADQLRGWIQGTRDGLLADGLIDAAEHGAWTSMFQNYVPLRGLEGMAERQGTGQGFNIRGTESRQALGRRSEATQIIEQIIADRTRAYIRAGKNEVLRSFGQFVIDNPSPNLWEINAVENKPISTLDANGNRVIEERLTVIGDDRTVTFKDGGKEVHILVNDERLRIQLQNLHVDSTGLFIGGLLYVNRMMGRLYTALNPVFTVLNGARDAAAAGIGMIDEVGFLGAAKTYALLPKSLLESYQAELGRYSPDYQLYRSTGGKTGFFDFKTLDAQTEELQALLANAERSGADPRVFGPKLMRFIEGMNGGIENATRLAAFKAARSSGLSLAEAARVSKNITVNFNRKGTLTPQLSAWFLFFNPAVQGTARMLQALKSPKVLATLGAGMGGMFALALRNAGMGDDDDGVAWWDKVPDETKERNVIIMLPPGASGGEGVPGSKTGRYLKIPMPYGYNFFAVVANQAADYWRHSQDPKRGRSALEGANKALNAFMGAWIPVAELGTALTKDPKGLAMMATPDALNPIMQNVINMNAFGSKMTPDDPQSRYMPDSTKYFAGQAGTLFQKGAEQLNALSGGSRYEPGLIDMAPASLENLVRGYMGGPASFVLDIGNAVYARQSLERPDLERQRLPFVKQLYGVIDAETDRMVGYERLDKAEQKLARAQQAKKDGNMEALRQMMGDEAPMLALGEEIKLTREGLAKLRKDELSIINSTTLSDGDKLARLRMMNERRRRVLQDFNRAYDQSLSRPTARPSAASSTAAPASARP